MAARQPRRSAMRLLLEAELRAGERGGGLVTMLEAPSLRRIESRPSALGAEVQQGEPFGRAVADRAADARGMERGAAEVVDRAGGVVERAAAEQRQIVR